MTSTFVRGHRQNVALSASVIVPLLLDMFEPQSVLDVGCAHGEWVAEFQRLDVEAVGVDLAADDPHIRHDLTEPMDLGRTFDLVLSLETGEHLPEDSAGIFVGSLVHHADRIVFSAAVPGQEGLPGEHVNCQPHLWWHAMFSAHGYHATDPIRPLVRFDRRVLPWYRNNIYVYEKT